jgi:biopolymer transport protein ExbD
MPPMTIRIDASGAVFSGTGLSEQPLDSDPDSRTMPLLAGQLALYRDAARAAGDEPRIFFRVDQNARQQRVIDVLDAFAVAGILTVAFEDLAPL